MRVLWFCQRWSLPFAVFVTVIAVLWAWGPEDTRFMNSVSPMMTVPTPAAAADTVVVTVAAPTPAGPSLPSGSSAPVAAPVVEPATVTAQAVRGSATQLTPTVPPPPAPVGLNGLPFAPPELTGCDQMEWYRVQAGLPADFDWIGFEESSCRNDVSTWCCFGHYQIYADYHIGTGSATECAVTEISDMFDTTDLSMQKNACMAARVYRSQGFCAWDVVSWCS